jgi:ParB-like chromosome segregation protein Spo0J
MTTDNTKRKQDKDSLPDITAVHKVAKLFPMLPEKELHELRDDIKANGMKMPILVNKAGDTILDGRNRWMIAHQLKLTKDQVPMETFTGKDEDIPAAILSRNIFRRHLTDDQRVALLAKVLAPKLEAEAQARMKAGKADPKSSTGGTSVIMNSPEGSEVAQQLAAKGKVSEHKARQSLKALHAGLADDVIAGKKSLRKATEGLPKKTRSGRAKQPPTLEDRVWKSFDRFMKHWDITLHRKVKEILRGYLDKSLAK